MDKRLILVATALLTLNVIGVANAADDGELPDIAAYDDVAYFPLPDVVSSEFDGLTSEVSVVNTEMADTTDASDNSGLPEISAYDDDAFEKLPDMIPAQ
jgi:hypothetical protein